MVPIIGRVCERCGIPLTVKLDVCGECDLLKGNQVDKIRSLLWFTDEAKIIIHLVKFKNRYEWLEIFEDYLRGITFPFIEEGFTLIPVPIHRRKFLRRGFNQSEILLGIIGEKLQHPISFDLKKIKETKPQSLLGGLERKVNLYGSFEWDSKEPVPSKVIIIDDIFTTGETLKACARVLKSRGAEVVYAWTLFRTLDL